VEELILLHQVSCLSLGSLHPLLKHQPLPLQLSLSLVLLINISPILKAA
jgi:hypothetical protein